MLDNVNMYLFPFLCALYLNNSKTFLTIKNVQKKHFQRLRKRITNYVKLFTVLYADDTVLLTESSEETFGVKN